MGRVGMLTAPASTMTIAQTDAKMGRLMKKSANILVGTPEGSRAPREELGRAELVLPHAIHYPPSFAGGGLGSAVTRAPGRSFCTPEATMRSPACSPPVTG